MAPESAHSADPARGERLLRQIHDFRQELRALAASDDPAAVAALADLAPYAMIFGLGGPIAVSLPDPGPELAQRPEAADPSSALNRYNRFAGVWLQTCQKHGDHAGGLGGAGHGGLGGR